MDDSTTQSPLLDPECRVPIVPFASELRPHRIPRAWEGSRLFCWFFCSDASDLDCHWDRAGNKRLLPPVTCAIQGRSTNYYTILYNNLKNR